MLVGQVRRASMRLGWCLFLKLTLWSLLGGGGAACEHCLCVVCASVSSACRRQPLTTLLRPTRRSGASSRSCAPRHHGCASSPVPAARRSAPRVATAAALRGALRARRPPHGRTRACWRPSAGPRRSATGRSWRWHRTGGQRAWRLGTWTRGATPPLLVRVGAGAGGGQCDGDATVLACVQRVRTKRRQRQRRSWAGSPRWCVPRGVGALIGRVALRCVGRIVAPALLSCALRYRYCACTPAVPCVRVPLRCLACVSDACGSTGAVAAAAAADAKGTRANGEGTQVLRGWGQLFMLRGRCAAEVTWTSMCCSGTQNTMMTVGLRSRGVVCR